MRKIGYSYVAGISLLVLGCATQSDIGHNIPPNTCAKLEVSVHSDGHLRHVKVLESAGIDNDIQIMEALKAAVPYEPFPESFANKNGFLTVTTAFCSDSKGGLKGSINKLNIEIKHITNGSTGRATSAAFVCNRYAHCCTQNHSGSTRC